MECLVEEMIFWYYFDLVQWVYIMSNCKFLRMKQWLWSSILLSNLIFLLKEKINHQFYMYPLLDKNAKSRTSSIIFTRTSPTIFTHGDYVSTWDILQLRFSILHVSPTLKCVFEEMMFGIAMTQLMESIPLLPRSLTF